MRLPKSELNTKQVQALQGLHYWFFELQWALYDEDEEEVERCRKNVEFCIEQCDKVGVSFKYQNNIFCNTTRHTSFDELVA